MEEQLEPPSLAGSAIGLPRWAKPLEAIPVACLAQGTEFATPVWVVECRLVLHRHVASHSSTSRRVPNSPLPRGKWHDASCCTAMLRHTPRPAAATRIRHRRTGHRRVPNLSPPPPRSELSTASAEAATATAESGTGSDTLVVGQHEPKPNDCRRNLCACH